MVSRSTSHTGGTALKPPSWHLRTTLRHLQASRTTTSGKGPIQNAFDTALVRGSHHRPHRVWGFLCKIPCRYNESLQAFL